MMIGATMESSEKPRFLNFKNIFGSINITVGPANIIIRKIIYPVIARAPPA